MVRSLVAYSRVRNRCRQLHGDLNDAKNDDAEFVRAVKLTTRSYYEIDSLGDPSSSLSKKARAQCAGRKRKAPEVRIGLIIWFIDIRETLKGQFPRCSFKMKANQLYEE